ncbi:MAG: DUF3108 domain-containing protein [Hyphomicrobiaceae bacterium]
MAQVFDARAAGAQALGALKARAGQLGVALLIGVGSVLPAFAAPPAAADPAWPSQVSSVYRLYFNGFEVGKFAFQSSTKGQSYSATSKAEVSALFGAFRWRGNTSATGRLADTGPEPASYLLNFKTKSKAGLVRLGFDKKGVKSVAVKPEKAPSPEAVPVKAEDMRSVFDPMSAILQLTHAGPGNPCAKTVPIFDGKARFNLVMSYKGRQKIDEKQPSGQPKELYVCKVKYQPVSGHKPKDFVNPWVDYDGIEIALRPIPAAGLQVPYQVVIPTSLGSAVMSAESIDIAAADGKSPITLRR